jgi:hypothetical protein
LILEPRLGFAIFLFSTVLALVAVVITGLRARVPIHIACVATTLVLLGVTIYFAEKLGELYDLQRAGVITPIHLTLAKTTTAAYLLPIVSGVMTLRNRARRALHFKLAMLVLTLTALTAITGSLMLWMAPAR